MAALPDHGIIPALWTPTDAAGRILEAELTENLAFIRQHPVHGLMVLGSTGEFVHLDLATRRHLLELVAAAMPGLPAMANISDVRPAVVAELGRAARDLGYAAVSLLPPWFFPLHEDDLAEFFIRSAEAAGLPLFLYNFPERTGHRLSLDVIRAIARRVPVAGLKQSGAEFDYHPQLVALGRELGFVVLTGADCRLAEALALGVTGCVGGLANIVPDWMLGVYDAVQAGDAPRVARATARMAAFGRVVDTVEFPVNVGAAMLARGLKPGVPKSIVSAATQARCERLIAASRALFAVA